MKINRLSEKIWELKYYVVFILISIILNIILFSRVGDGEILYVHDQFIKFSFQDAFISSFFIKKFRDLGVHNSFEFIITFWDYLYYLAVYKLGFSLIEAERVLFFILDFLLLALPFAGFGKLKKIFDVEVDDLVVFCVSLWYAFNPYILITKHVGVSTLGWILTYSLAPLILYYFHKGVLQTKLNLKYAIACALLVYVASFTFWLFAVFSFFLFFYFLFQLFSNKKEAAYYLVNIQLFALLAVPLLLPIVFGTVFEFVTPAGQAKAGAVPTYMSQRGGMWYQLLLISSWSIYVDWSPRTLFPFAGFFLSVPYTISMVVLYTSLLIGLLPIENLLLGVKKISGRARSHAVILLVILFISVFFAKAAQPPLGEIFTSLFEGISFFRVFRSADFRFGFSTVLSVSLLLLILSHRLNKYVVSVLLLVITLFQGYRIINGTAYTGKNIGQSYYDRVIKIPDDYKEVAEFVNSNGRFGYILPVHSVYFGHFLLDGGDHHIGQDVLSRLTRPPFIYLSLVAEVMPRLSEKFIIAIGGKDLPSLRDLPIRYVLHRRDLICPNCIPYSDEDFDGFDLVYENDSISVYETNSFKPLLYSENLEFQIINPVKYRVRLSELSRSQTLEFIMNSDKNWNLYLDEYTQGDFCEQEAVSYSGIKECLGEYRVFERDDLSYLLKRPVFEETKTAGGGFANFWEIDPKSITTNFSRDYYHLNEDGSVNLDLIIYYQPQSVFYLTFVISGLVLVSYFGFLLWKRINQVKS